MSIKIKVRKRIFEGQDVVNTSTGQGQTDAPDASTAATPTNTNASTGTATNPTTNQTANTQNAPTQNTSTNTQNTSTNVQNASTTETTNGIDVNQFVKEVTNLYIDICTKMKEACKPDNMKAHMTLYDKMKETAPYKGLEKEFADAVNGMAGIDPKNFQQGFQQFSKVIDELGKYTTKVANAASNLQPVPNAPTATPAPTTGQTTTTTTTNPVAQQQAAANPA